MTKIFKKIALLGAMALLLTSILISGCVVDSLYWVKSQIKRYYYYYDSELGEKLKSATLKDIYENKDQYYLDLYSEYMTAEEYQALMSDNEGSKSGVGIQYSFNGTNILVEKVVGNSPAYKAGVRKGMQITEVRTNSGNFAMNQLADFASAVSPLKENEVFTIITTEGAITLSKQEYTASYTALATKDCTYTVDPKSNSIEHSMGGIDYLPENMAYLSVQQFYGTAGSEVGTLIKQYNTLFAGKENKSLILDLRDNGGGYVTCMQEMAGYFTQNVPKANVAMKSKERSGAETIFPIDFNHTDDTAYDLSTNLYVMANAGTASASEALIGVLISYNLLSYENIYLSTYGEEYCTYYAKFGEVKNSRSYGKGIMQSTFRCPDGSAIKLTTAEIFWPNGKSIHDKGLTLEDGCKSAPAKWSVTRLDEELQYVVQQITK